MIRAHVHRLGVIRGIPRESGDDPPMTALMGAATKYSPRERG